MNAKTMSLVAVAIAVAGVVFLAFKDYLISSNPLGLSIQGLAFGLMLWARVTFGRRSFHAGANPTEGEMVTRGPYRYLRHPIYAAATYFILAGVFSHRSADAIAVAVLVVLCLVVRILLEEQFLKAAYPDYVEYSGRTKRIIPFVF
ncbi:MAG TPA: methyltransferase [Bacteroidota bacterium]|jgi:protein-S-isoprenylcysteine O-methyltransferase Ste14